MSSDTLVADASDLSPRAHIALLTLQLRAAIREAEEAELAEQEWDADAATAHLRDTLQPLVDERRAALDDELARARTEAAARIESVRATLDAAAPRSVLPSAAPLEDAPVPDVEEEPHAEEEPVIDVPATAPVGRVTFLPPMPLPPPVVEFPLDPPGAEAEALAEIETTPMITSRGDTSEGASATFAPPVVEMPAAAVPYLTAPPIIGPSFAPPVVECASADVEPPLTSASGSAELTAAIWGRPSASAAPLTADDVRAIVAELLAETTARNAAALPVAIDPESFSRAFAAAFGAALGAALDERLAGLPYGPPHGAPRYVAPAPKRSFWANMWHADVMMSLLAAVIVLVVLIAWST